ncbi:hypothetical protein [Aquabacterium sp.]|uniref:lipopolysaccharide biosynthesis protein n=1 Tax=Aquabacterium sp. TaxID=1872578 RepID=UPI0019CA1982|nr:hypothetical protein [Aquabacterium sp.]MBC7701807.1 hypothetical protein [Aquabacterium sp.]
MSPLIRRVVAALGANAVGQAINIVIQLASLPLFLHRWDVATYGTWLMLSAIPAYLSMADVGMVAAAGNRMTMAMGRGDAKQANTIFQSAMVFMLLVCGSIAALSLPLLLWAPMPGLVQWDERLALAALVLTVLLALFGGLAEAIFKSTERYAQGTMLANGLRLAEWVGCMLGLFIGGTFATVAIAGLMVRATGVLWMIWRSSKGQHPFTWGLREAHITEVRAMATPAISFMAFPLANAMSFQGVTLVVGHLFGPAVVAVFNTYRTLARVAVQVTGIFGHALWAELSRLYGRGGAQAVAGLYRRSAWTGAALSVGLSLVLYLVAPWLLQVWTHGRIGVQPTLMAILLVYAAAGGVWHVPRVLLMATNQHVGLAQWTLLAAALSLGLSWVLGNLLGLEGAGVAMLLTELGIAGVCVFLAHRMTSLHPLSQQSVAS